MRLVANFTLHALLAAAIAALASTAAAAKDAAKFSLVAATPKTSGGTYALEHIEVLSYSFGNPRQGRVGKVDGFAVKQGVKQDPNRYGEWIADVERPAEAKAGGSNEIRMEDRAGAEAKERQAGSLETIADREKETAGFQGRGLDIARVDGQMAHPPGKGSVWVRVASPWASCRVGDRYSSMELVGGRQSYVFQYAVVTACSESEVSFAYAKVKVRGWNPEKKEL